MYDLLIRDATILSRDKRRVVDIALEGGLIAYVGDNPGGRARETIPAIGRFVMPGAIDANVQLGGAETWRSLSRAAAAAGVTTLLLRGQDPGALAALRAEAARDSIVNYGCWAAAGPGPEGLGEALDLAHAGQVCGLELDLATCPADTVEAAFAGRPPLLGVHIEEGAVLAAARAALGEVRSPAHGEVRPPAAAVAGAEAVLARVRAGATATHVFSVSTIAELSVLDRVRGDLPLSLEVVPDHLFLSQESSAAMLPSLKRDPPVRTELDRRGLWTAIKRGRLDTFASGHVPLPRAEGGADYWRQPAGVPGLDSLLRLLLSAVRSGRMGLEQLVEMCAENPARIFRLPGRGAVRAGAAADLVMFREGEVARFRPEDIQSAAGWSPHAGRELAGPPLLVVINGRIVARDGRLLDDVLPGQALSFGGEVRAPAPG